MGDSPASSKHSSPTKYSRELSYDQSPPTAARVKISVSRCSSRMQASVRAGETRVDQVSVSSSTRLGRERGTHDRRRSSGGAGAVSVALLERQRDQAREDVGERFVV